MGLYIVRSLYFNTSIHCCPITNGALIKQIVPQRGDIRVLSYSCNLFSNLLRGLCLSMKCLEFVKNHMFAFQLHIMINNE